jgi:trehalose 6-phosphate phosphatase
LKQTCAILAERNLPVLRRFAATDVLLAFDYDGTLAPIAATPAGARMRASTRHLLVKTAQTYACAVISGRAYRDISARLAGIGIQHVFGNHGLEPPDEGAPPQPQVRQWLAMLRERLASQRGVVVEDKDYSLTVHYRAAPDRQRSLELIHRVVGELADARVIGGSEAVNLLPKTGSNKGIALRRAMEESGCEAVLYVGDEQTDEDAFAAISRDRLLAIRVESSPASYAPYHLESQQEIDVLLRTLLHERRPT